MKTKAEVREAKAFLEQARVHALAARSADAEDLRMFVDLLDWVLGEKSVFGPTMETQKKISRRIDSAAGN